MYVFHEYNFCFPLFHFLFTQTTTYHYFTIFPAILSLKVNKKNIFKISKIGLLKPLFSKLKILHSFFFKYLKKMNTLKNSKQIYY